MSFPTSPTNGQNATVNGIQYIYSSGQNAWTRVYQTSLNISGTFTSAGNIVGGAAASTNTTTGGIVVTGGVGVAGNINAGSLYSTTGIKWTANNQNIATSLTTGSTPPASPIRGDQWYNTGDDTLYEYIYDGTSTYWVDVQGATISGNATTTTDTLSPFLLAGM